MTKTEFRNLQKNVMKKQYKLDHVRHELNKSRNNINELRNDYGIKQSRLKNDSIIYYHYNDDSISYLSLDKRSEDSGKLYRSNNLDKLKKREKTVTTLQTDIRDLSIEQVKYIKGNEYKRYWNYGGEIYGVKPGRIDRIDGSSPVSTNLYDVKGYDFDTNYWNNYSNIRWYITNDPNGKKHNIDWLIPKGQNFINNIHEGLRNNDEEAQLICYPLYINKNSTNCVKYIDKSSLRLNSKGSMSNVVTKLDKFEGGHIAGITYRNYTQCYRIFDNQPKYDICIACWPFVNYLRARATWLFKQRRRYMLIPLVSGELTPMYANNTNRFAISTDYVVKLNRYTFEFIIDRTYSGFSNVLYRVIPY